MAGLSDLTRAVKNEFGLKNAEARTLLEFIFEEIRKETANSNVSIKDFGVFKAKDVAARKIRNPQTGEELEVGASSRVQFTAGQYYKDQVKAAKGLLSPEDLAAHNEKAAKKAKFIPAGEEVSETVAQPAE